MDLQLLEHRREWRMEETRVGAIERALAILQTKFEGALERAVSGDDLKELKREVDDNMKQTVHNIRDYFDNKTDQQSRDILQQVEIMLSHQREGVTKEQQAMRRQIFMMMLSTVFTVIGSIAFLVLTGRG